MTGPAPAVAAVRTAIREDLTPLAPTGDEPAPLVLVACSGGPDSLALAAGAAFVAPRLGLRAGAVVVDHGLQADSAEVAERAATACRSLGLTPVQVRAVDPDGPGEAELRAVRHEALDAAAVELGAVAVLLGHTLDDQAEQVLLGLARGSGARSLAGMPAVRGRLRRPLLGLRREVLGAACDAQGLEPWHDPTNHPDGGGARRSSVRHTLLPVLEKALGPGVAPALARTADLLRADAEVLEPLSDELLARAREAAGPGLGLDVAVLGAAPTAVRTRALRSALIDWGAPAGALSAAHVAAVDALVTRWAGQGPAHLPGLLVQRRYGRLSPHTPTSQPGSDGGRS